jgi:hypothetical protein
MGNRAWTTPEQRTWLESQIPDFVRAQQDRTVGLFLKDIYNRWEEKWPTPPPTEAEVKRVKGNIEKASAIKRKGTEGVRTHNETLAALMHPPGHLAREILVSQSYQGLFIWYWRARGFKTFSKPKTRSALAGILEQVPEHQDQGKH